MFKFLHIADLHIGCTQLNSDERFLDFCRAFQCAANLAIDNYADAVLIAGDLFHQRSINANTLKHAQETLTCLKSAGICVFAIEGNHDKAFFADRKSWMEYLNDIGLLTLLKPEFDDNGNMVLSEHNGTGCVAYIKGVRIIGLGYPGALGLKRLKELDELLNAETPTVLMLHAAVDMLLGIDLGGVSGGAVETLKGKIDYVALGHIHSRREHFGFAYNPGAPENVHIDECMAGRQKGFYMVELDNDGTFKADFIEYPYRHIEHIEIDTGKAQSPDELTENALSLLDTLKNTRGAVLSLKLTGFPPFPPYTIDTDVLSKDMESRYGFLRVQIVNAAMEAGASSEFSSFDAEELELLVLDEMAAQVGISRENGETGAFIRSIHRALLSGTPESEIAGALRQWRGVEKHVD